MKRIFSPYYLWEDYLNGMYTTEVQSESFVLKSVEFLSKPIEFERVLQKVYKEWVNSVNENLSNKNCNRKAWLGQSACNYNHKANDLTVRKAWSILTPTQRYLADEVALKFIKKYEKENSEIYKAMGEPLL